MGNLAVQKKNIRPMAPALSQSSLFPLTEWFDRLRTGILEEFRIPSAYPVDARATDEEYQAQVNLPGIDEGDLVQVKVADGAITITAENSEGSCGYNYSFSIPHWVDEGSITAKFHNGTLNISAPKPEHLRPREIPVEVVDNAQT